MTLEEYEAKKKLGAKITLGGASSSGTALTAAGGDRFPLCICQACGCTCCLLYWCLCKRHCHQAQPLPALCLVVHFQLVGGCQRDGCVCLDEDDAGDDWVALPCDIL